MHCKLHRISNGVKKKYFLLSVSKLHFIVHKNTICCTLQYYNTLKKKKEKEEYYSFYGMIFFAQKLKGHSKKAKTCNNWTKSIRFGDLIIEFFFVNLTYNDTWVNLNILPNILFCKDLLIKIWVYQFSYLIWFSWSWLISPGSTESLLEPLWSVSSLVVWA